MKRQFKILTDSGCDMPTAYLAEQDVEAVSLGFLMDEVSYLGEDGKPIDTKDFYAKLRAGAMPSTYQVNVECAKTHVETYLKEGRDVLVIAFSGALSGTANSFAVAANELNEQYPTRKVRVIDSLCASMGQGLFLHYAIQKAETGATVEETAEYLESIKQNVCHYFTVSDLFHLQRGGRVSKATAILGTMLKIKPVLYVDEKGRLINIGKSVGRKKAIKALFEKMCDVERMQEGDPVYISHGDCEEDANYLADMIRGRFPNCEIVIHYVGPVIGAHSGPDTLALFFFGKERAK